jgi:hypothetical protein
MLWRWSPDSRDYRPSSRPRSVNKRAALRLAQTKGPLSTTAVKRSRLIRALWSGALAVSGPFKGEPSKQYSLPMGMPGSTGHGAAADLLEKSKMKVVVVIDIGRIAIAIVMLVEMLSKAM